MASRFEVSFDTTPLLELDEFALLAEQEFNLGNEGDWFSHFRGGVYAVHGRLYGVTRHYHDLHAWGSLSPVEHDLSMTLFCMDSALECLVFALNALGWGAGAEFRDVTADRALRQVKIRDVFMGQSGDEPQTGFAALFPTFSSGFNAHRITIGTIADLHDVSKHRQVIYRGGQRRNDPPSGFFQRLGIAASSAEAVILSPHAEILLPADPKAPAADRQTEPYDPERSLEHLAAQFQVLVDQSVAAALADARNNINLERGAL